MKKNNNYKLLRNAYYLGILLLVVYALQFINPIKQFVIPIMETNIVPGLPIIGIIAILTGIAGFQAYKYRTLG